MSMTPPGWYPSPERPGWLQWFDGELWQQHFQPTAQPMAQAGWGQQQGPGGGANFGRGMGMGMGPGTGMGSGMGMGAGSGGVMWLRWVILAISATFALVLILSGDAVFGALLGVLVVARFALLLWVSKRRRDFSDRTR